MQSKKQSNLGDMIDPPAGAVYKCNGKEKEKEKRRYLKKIRFMSEGGKKKRKKKRKYEKKTKGW